MKRNGTFVIKRLIVGLSIVLLGVTFYHYGIRTVINQRIKEKNDVIVIDPGHGGVDPGKVGVNDCLEKDINLKIAFHLKTFLEQNGYEIVMTRTEDVGLYGASDSNKKAADLKKRVKIINDTKPLLAVSVHQNSFAQASSKGAQVFFHEKSEEGKAFAEIVQDQIKKSIGDGNRRVAKSNNNYYMLKNTECPFIIIECGFLSNHVEAESLCSESYQEKMAWAIHLGILSYMNQKDGNE